MKLEAYLKTVFHQGSLEVILPGGGRIVLGDGGEPRVVVALKDRATVARIAARPGLALGEAYMAGALTFEVGTIADLLELASMNGARRPDRRPASAAKRWWLDQTRQRNARNAARRNVAHHYDLSVDLYRLFLDRDLQYSCALFEEPGASLDDAQVAKKRHIAAKLLLKPGQRVLDIGCGWGGMALTLAAAADVRVDGVTLSTEQLATARTRAEAMGLGGKAHFELTDYRDVTGTYDRIVSVGMFEHVGPANYQTFFNKVADLVADDGVALIHSIGRSGPPSTTDAWTTKYIFPGAHLPSLSEVFPAVEKAGLWVTDMEILRLHYAKTLAHWRARFMANRDQAAALYDERFCRMWEYYLAAAEMGFRHGGHMNFQLQLSKRVDAVPLTRSYIDEAERALADEGRSAA
ncbi:MAG TPA: cyclopropane-fatty-acyl-phospholipid synthase family protein [Caulobacteraceae bacterium]